MAKFKLGEYLMNAIKKPEAIIQGHSKNPAIIVNKVAENVVVGDKVKVNEFYLANYCGMDCRVDIPATVIRIDTRKVKIDEIEKADRAMYVSMYGKKSSYDMVSYMIMYPNNTKVYMVSPFGYDKVTIESICKPNTTNR